MTTLDVVAQPGAAARWQRVRAHAALELQMMLCNGEQLLLTIILPVGLLLGLSLSTVVDLGVPDDRLSRLDVVVPGMLALAVLSTAFTGLAIQTGFERRYGVLKRLGATPLSRGDLLSGKVCAVLCVEAIQVTLLTALGVLLGWRPNTAGLFIALGFIIVGTAAFASLGLLLAGTARAEATLAGANVIYLLLLAAGGIIVPASELPEAAQSWVQWLPSSALAEGLRDATIAGSVNWLEVLVLGIWFAVGAALASRYFRWD